MAEKEIQGAGMYYEIGVDYKKHDREAKKVEKRTEKLGKNIDKHLRKMSKNTSAQELFEEIDRTAQESAKEFSKSYEKKNKTIDKHARNVKNVYGQQVKDMKLVQGELEKTLKSYGKLSNVLTTKKTQINTKMFGNLADSETIRNMERAKKSMESFSNAMARMRRFKNRDFGKDFAKMSFDIELIQDKNLKKSLEEQMWKTYNKGNPDLEQVKYMKQFTSMSRSNELKSNKSTLSSRMMDYNPAPMYGLSRGLWSITDQFEKAGKQASAFNLAIKKLGTDANPKKLINMVKDIQAGIGRARLIAMGGLITAGAASYGGYQLAKGDNVGETRDEYYAQVDEQVKAYTSQFGKFELAESELLKRRKDVVLGGKTIFGELEDEIAKERLDAMQSWMKPFEEMTDKVFGIDKMKKNLRKQVEAVRDFNKNMQKLMADGANIETINYFASEGLNSAGELKTLVEASKKDRNQIYKDMLSRSSGMDKINATMTMVDGLNLVGDKNKNFELIESFRKEQQKLLDNQNLPLEFRAHVAGMDVSQTSKLKGLNSLKNSDLQSVVDGMMKTGLSVNQTANGQNMNILPEINKENMNRFKMESERASHIVQQLEKTLSPEAFYFVKDLELPQLELIKNMNPKEMDDYIKKLRDSSMDGMDSIFKDQNKVLRSQHQKMYKTISKLGEAMDLSKHQTKDTWKPFGDSFGFVGSKILGIFDGIQKGIEGVDKSTNGALSQFLGWGAIVGGMLTAILAPLAVAGGFFGFSAVFGAIAAAIGPLLVGLAAVMGVVIPLTAAIVGGAIAIKEMWQNSDKLRSGFGKFAEAYKGAWGGFFNILKSIWGVIEKIIFAIASLTSGKDITSWSELWKTMGDILGRMFEKLSELYPKIETFFNKIAELINTFSDSFGKKMSEIMGKKKKNGKSPLLDFFDLLIDSIGKFLDLLNSGMPKLIPFVSKMGEIAAVSFVAIVEGVTGVTKAITKLIDAMSRLKETDKKKDGGSSFKESFMSFGRRSIVDAVMPGMTGMMIPGYAIGTSGHPGGLAVVGEKGMERIQLPNGQSFFSPPTDTLMNLPQGTQVFTNQQTKQELSGFRNKVPQYAGGTGNTMTTGMETPIFNVFVGNEQLDARIVRVSEEGSRRNLMRRGRNRGETDF